MIIDYNEPSKHCLQAWLINETGFRWFIRWQNDQWRCAINRIL